MLPVLQVLLLVLRVLPGLQVQLALLVLLGQPGQEEQLDRKVGLEV